MSSTDKHSFIVYIDEAGDQGFKFASTPGGSGSSRWFCIAAAVFHASEEPQQVKVIDTAMQKLLSKQVWERSRTGRVCLHFRDLDHDKRIECARIVSRARMSVTVVLVDKTELYPGRFKEKDVLYRYVSRLLVERVSWLCRDRFDDEESPTCKGNGRARIVFSNRKTMSYDDLRSYFSHLRRKGEDSIVWRVVDPNDIDSVPHERIKGLQIADVVASSFFHAVEPNRFGDSHIQYVEQLKPRLYRAKYGRRGAIGYGLKLYPSTSFESADRLIRELKE